MHLFHFELVDAFAVVKNRSEFYWEFLLSMKCCANILLISSIYLTQ